MEEPDYKHPSENFLRSIDALTILPQREPFVMIGAMTGYDETTTTTETRIEAENILADNGVLSTAGIMENIAQTSAARIGYENKFIRKQGVQIGVIGSFRHLAVNGHPRVGDTIRTRVTVVQELMGVTLATAEVTMGGKTLATAQIKLAIRNQDKEEESCAN